MKELRERVAVVTGAASGIGLALAQRFAAEGMRVVLADIEESALEQAERGLREQGAAVVALRTDVSQASDVERLAKRALEAFGAVHVLCNNAGVAGTAALSWQRTLADWEWILGVNLWGVIHGLRTFVPILLEQGDEGHVVNTASMAGLLSGPVTADYAVTKHAVVTLSESLHFELALSGAKPKVSVLCPAWVSTRIIDSDRNRSEASKRASAPALPGPAPELLEKRVRALISEGMPPVQVAEKVVEAIRAERFWVLTHPDWKEKIRTRMDDVLAERNPSFVPIF